MGLVGAILKSKDLLLDCTQRIPELLRSRTRVGTEDHPRFHDGSIGARTYQIPLGAESLTDPEEKQLALDAAKNFLAMFRSMKLPVSSVAGSISGVQFGKLMRDVEREWHVTEGAFIELVVIYAQKL
jgi:hypothetical protein